MNRCAMDIAPVSIMEHWVNEAWAPCDLAIEGPKPLLIDSFAVHHTSCICNLIAHCNTELEIIPPGCTSKPQAMDVGIDKPFKDRICHCIEDFLMENPTNTKSDCQVVSVSHWIGDTQESMSASMCINIWSHIGFCGGTSCPHPNPKENKMNQHHDPLALHPGGNTDVSKDDNDCDTDDSRECQ